MKLEWFCVILAILLYLWLLVTCLWVLRPEPLVASTLTVLTGLALWSYLTCVFTPPGYNEKDQLDLEYVTYCDKCDWYRPERAHHCRLCNKCVLRMDHHCPWIAGCVGYFNHGHFIRFIFYSCLASTTVCAMLSYRTWLAIKSDEMGEYLWGFILIFDLALSFFIALVLSLLLVTNLWACCLNRTTIEEAEFASSRGSTYPFDLGVWGNLRQFLGSRFLPLPLSAKLCGMGDGLTYPRISTQPWPPCEDILLEVSHEGDGEGHGGAVSRYWDEREKSFIVPGGLIGAQLK